jgi:hypothetical protein
MVPGGWFSAARQEIKRNGLLFIDSDVLFFGTEQDSSLHWVLRAQKIRWQQ